MIAVQSRVQVSYCKVKCLTSHMHVCMWNGKNPSYIIWSCWNLKMSILSAVLLFSQTSGYLNWLEKQWEIHAQYIGGTRHLNSCVLRLSTRITSRKRMLYIFTSLMQNADGLAHDDITDRLPMHVMHLASHPYPLFRGDSPFSTKVRAYLCTINISYVQTLHACKLELQKLHLDCG